MSTRGYGNVKYQFEYQIEDIKGTSHNLPSDSKEKDLGIVFENTLKFDFHITSIVNRKKQTSWIDKTNFEIIECRTISDPLQTFGTVNS